MEIIISNKSDKPIYEQITHQIRSAILRDELQAGEKLPSIRTLANALCVSVITTKRAYTDLETLGFIETVQGKGSFVAGGNDEYRKEQSRRAVEELLLKAIDEARGMHIDDAEITEMLETLLESQR